MAEPDHQVGRRQNRVMQLNALEHLPADVSGKTQLIHQSLLSQSGHIRSANFVSIAVTDLRLLFDLYDALFFGSLLQRWLNEDAAGEIKLTLSHRMTSAAGITYTRKTRLQTPSGIVVEPRYEISVSTYLLFENFHEGNRAVTISGLLCNDRLEALQRIFEHELLHLSETLVWGRSSCKAPNYHRLSRRIFGHEGTTHALVTPREMAADVYQVGVGDRVSFEFEGVRKVGIINRITKRATVLCEAPNGRLFSNGVRYETYYIPLAQLRKEMGPAER